MYGTDPASRTQVMSLMADGGVVLVIWWLESLRAGTDGAGRPWFVRHPALPALASQLLGLGVVSPLYYYASYVLQPASATTGTYDPPAIDNRRTPAALIPALVAGHYIPAAGAFLWPDLAERQAWLFAWQLYPVWVAVVFQVVSRLVHAVAPWWRGADEETKAGLRRSSIASKLARDRVAVRACLGASVTLAAATWLWAWWRSIVAFGSPSGMLATFIPTAAPRRSLPDLAAFCAEFLRWDGLFTMASTLLWLVYLLGDVAHPRIRQVGWTRRAAVALPALVVFGPGAVVGLGWLWREEVLAVEREREALMLEVAAKVEALLKANGA